MNEQTAKIIEQLANKLGTTTEFLWAVLMSQAKIEAILDAFYIVASCGVIVLTTWYCLKYSEEISELQGKGVLAIFLGIISVFAIMLSVACFGEMITAAFNPQYWALEQILKRL